MSIETHMKRLNATPLSRRVDPSDSHLRQLETFLGVVFPSSYAQFLKRFGKFRVNAKIDCKTLPGAYIAHFYGFRDDDDVEMNPGGEFNELGLAPVALCIGSDDWGNQIVLFLADGLNGRIYVYEHDGGADFMDDPNWQQQYGLSWTDLKQYDEASEKPAPFANLHYAAPDFMSFLESLQSNGGEDSA